ncbi:hypothetical protein PROFUN_12552 [Planoprotostelium fungivorum]|uniref:Uncharacterized protein n=1 Tax=Planoprotostelium fungivorum TaxID=1890364 RepID=A0A2P6N774_9EUKA|nr:hypothetical protein PROFUN_12552 [Planoprotostelium fungivorum]
MEDTTVTVHQNDLPNGCFICLDITEKILNHSALELSQPLEYGVEHPSERLYVITRSVCRLWRDLSNLYVVSEIPLINACKRKNLVSLRHLLTLELRPSLIQTALSRAVSANLCESILILIEDDRLEDKDILLHTERAAMLGLPEALTSLLQHNSARCLTPDANVTATIFNILPRLPLNSVGDLSVFMILFHKINNEVPCDARMEAVRLLRDGRADPSANDNEAIRMAAKNGHHEVVELLAADLRVEWNG